MAEPMTPPTGMGQDPNAQFETIQPVGGRAFQMPLTAADRVAKARAAKEEVRAEMFGLARQYQQLKEADPLGAEKIFSKAEALNNLIPEYDKVEQDLVGKIEGSLKNGQYLKEAQDFSENGIAQTLSKNISAVVGGNVDMQRSVDPDTRRSLAFMSGPTQDEFLAQQFGPENFKTVNIGGEAVRLVKQQDGTWVPTNEMGATSSDMWTVAGEAFPTLMSIAGNVAGAALMKSPTGVAAGGAAGYALGGSVQDAIVKEVFKSGPGFIESMPERVAQGVVGGGIELGTTKVLAPAIRGAATAIAGKQNRMATRMRVAEDELRQQGVDIRFAQLSSGGDKKITQRLAAAERLPNWQLGRDVAVARQRIASIEDAMRTGMEAPQALRQQAVDVLRNERDAAASVVGLYDKKAAEAIAKGYDEKILQAQTAPGRTIPQAGKYLWQELKSAEARANNIKNEAYQAFYEKANPVISADPIQLAKSIEKQYLSSPVRSAEMDRALAELRMRPANAQRIKEIDAALAKNPEPDIASNLQYERASLEQLAGPLNAQQLDNYVQIFRDAAPDQIVGAATKKRAAGNAADAIQAFRDDLYRKNGLYNDWAQARAVYENRMGFQQQQLGSIMKNTFGRSDLTESQLIHQSLSDPRTLQDVLSAVQIGDPGRLPQVRASLQSAYLEKIGLANRNGRAIKDFDFDPDIVRSLYGDDLQGRLMAMRLGKLRDTVKRYGVDASKITQDDVAELGKYISEKNANEVTENIAKRVKAQQDLERVQREALLKVADKGHTEAITREKFSEALWNTDPKRIAKIMSKFGPEDQKLIRGDFAEYFFQRYHQQTDIGDNVIPWNGRMFLDDIAKDKSIYRNMEAVLGPETATKLRAASEATLVLERKAAGVEGIKGGMVLTQNQQKGYLQARPIIDMFGHRILAAQYKAGQLIPILNRLATKELTPDQWNKTMFYGLMSTATSAKGFEAMLGVGRYDPEWSAYIGQNLGIPQLGSVLGMGESMQEGIEYRKEYGKER